MEVNKLAVGANKAVAAVAVIAIVTRVEANLGRTARSRPREINRGTRAEAPTEAGPQVSRARVLHCLWLSVMTVSSSEFR